MESNVAADAATGVFSPELQYGFAGVCVLLIGILGWMVRWFTGEVKDGRESRDALLEKVTNVIGANTHAINELTIESREARKAASKTNDLLLSRPCLCPKDTR